MIFQRLPTSQVLKKNAKRVLSEYWINNAFDMHLHERFFVFYFPYDKGLFLALKKSLSYWFDSLFKKNQL